MSGKIAHGGGITAAARLFGGRPEEWLDLSTGINPTPVSLPDIPVSAWHRLPDEHRVEAAREGARQYYRSGDIRPLPVPGTQSVIQLLPRLLDPGAGVAVMSPTYGEYARAFARAGFVADPISSVEAVNAAHQLVVVVNPNNPDGRLLGADLLLELHEELRARGGFLVVDEAFGDGNSDASLAAYASRLPNLVIFRSFGKFFGLAGLRLGFVIAHTSLLDRFDEWLGPWAVSGPALAIAADLFARDTAPIRERIGKRRQALGEVLAGAGLNVAGGTELFALVADPRASHIYDHLARHRILVRKFDYAVDWLRFGLTPGEEADRRLAAALANMERA